MNLFAPDGTAKQPFDQAMLTSNRVAVQSFHWREFQLIHLKFCKKLEHGHQM
jgi:hypothetical protein